MPVGRIYEPPPPSRIIPVMRDSEFKVPPSPSKTISIKIQIAGQNGTSKDTRSNGDTNGSEKGDVSTVISVPIRIVKDPSPIRATIKLPPSSLKVSSPEREDVPVSTSRPLSIPISKKSLEPNASENNVSPPTPIVIVEDEVSNGYSSDINNNSSSPEKEILEEKSVFSSRLDFIKPEHAKGLRNLGNTCFMNSTLQCLAHCGRLLELIHEDDFYNEEGKSDLTDSFADVVRDLWSFGGMNANKVTVDPSKFKGEIGSFAPKFAGYNQHDSQEFLQYLLEGIHNELNRVDPETRKRESKRLAERSKEEEKEDCLLPPVEFGKKSFGNYLLRDNSHVTDIFMGQFRSTLKCLRCKNESVTFEPFWVVSLPIPPKSAQPKLEDCFRLFTKEEILDGDEKPFCEKCDHSRQKCAKWYTFEKWPQVLVVHFKRFESSRFRSKISHHIDVPVTNMSVGEFSSGTQFVSYDCFGISNHSGSLGGGHYTAYGRHPYYHSKWHLYNDSFVSKAGGDAVVSHEAYLLFFEKR